MSETVSTSMIKLSRAVAVALGLLSASAVLVTPAGASEPAPSGQVLGTIEALLGYCGSVDPKMAARYHEKVQLFVRGVDEKAVAEVRSSDEYKKAYESTVELFGQLDEENSRRTCSGSLADSI